MKGYHNSLSASPPQLSAPGQLNLLLESSAPDVPTADPLSAPDSDQIYLPPDPSAPTTIIESEFDHHDIVRVSMSGMCVHVCSNSHAFYKNA